MRSKRQRCVNVITLSNSQVIKKETSWNIKPNPLIQSVGVDHSHSVFYA